MVVPVLQWVKQQHLEQSAQQATLVGYLHEVEHMASRIEQLEQSIDSSLADAPAKMRAMVDALQALRGIAKISAVSVVAELGEISRFAIHVS